MIWIISLVIPAIFSGNPKQYSSSKEYFSLIDCDKALNGNKLHEEKKPNHNLCISYEDNKNESIIHHFYFDRLQDISDVNPIIHSDTVQVACKSNSILWKVGGSGYYANVKIESISNDHIDVIKLYKIKCDN